MGFFSNQHNQFKCPDCHQSYYHVRNLYPHLRLEHKYDTDEAKEIIKKLRISNKKVIKEII